MEKTEKKQFKELTEEELKEVTGGMVKDTPIALVSDESEFTCPDGRKVSSFSQCIVANEEVMMVPYYVAGEKR